MFIFSVYAFKFHSDMFFDAGLNESLCQTLLQCFLTAIHRVIF